MSSYFNYLRATLTGLEPVNTAVKVLCLKPLGHRAVNIYKIPKNGVFILRDTPAQRAENRLKGGKATAGPCTDLLLDWTALWDEKK